MTKKPAVSLEFKNLSIPQEIIFGQKVINDLTANAATFATPDVPIATLQTRNDDLQTAANEAAGGDHAKVQAMYAADRDWDTAFGAEADYVDRIANGAEATILLSGYKATKSETVPASIPAAPDVTVSKVNAAPGSVHVEVKFQQGTRTYIYFFSSTNAPIVLAENEFSFTVNPAVVSFITDNHRKVDFNNLPSGANLFLSVAAQNNAGTSVPSAPIAIKTL